MPTIKVAKAFNLLLRPSEPRQHFPAGEHDVTDEVADHWYTKAHLDGAEGLEFAEDAAPSVNDVTAGTDPAQEVAPVKDEGDGLTANRGDDSLQDGEADGQGVADASNTLQGSEGADTIEASGGDDPDPDPDPELDPALVDAMTDEELRTFITGGAGRAPHHNLGHEKLLAQAKALAEA